MTDTVTVDKNSPEYLGQRITSGRISLLIILVTSVINLVCLVLNTGRYFLFSATIPYALTCYGMALDNAASSGIGLYTAATLLASLVILAGFCLIWFFSKKHTLLLNLGSVLVAIDTFVLVACIADLPETPDSFLVDFLLHAIVVWELFCAAKAAKKLKTVQADASADEESC